MDLAADGLSCYASQCKVSNVATCAASGTVWGNKSHTPQSFLKCLTFLSPAFFVFPSLSSDLFTNLTPSYSNMHVRACLLLIRWITAFICCGWRWGHQLGCESSQLKTWCFLWRLPPLSSCSCCVHLNLDLKHLTGCQEAVKMFLYLMTSF